jgi:hypothetical protein
MGIVGGYELHLYCDVCPRGKGNGWRPKFDQFFGESLQGCLRQARREGWVIRPMAASAEGQNGLGRCVCPKHRRNKVK